MASDGSYFRGFTQYSRAWYARAPGMKRDGEEFMIGIYHREGGAAGEFAIRQHQIHGHVMTWKLEAFDDSWKTFPEFADLFAWLPTAEDAPAQVVRDALTRMGIEDKTPEENPPGVAAVQCTCSPKCRLHGHHAG